MPTISLTMIVKNEAAKLERLLSAAKTFCDELIVVDTGSMDQTVEIAERLGAKVFPFTWIDDFAAARNYSLAQCTGDWILWLDADDVLTEETQQQLLMLKTQVLNGSVDVIYLPYKYAFSAEEPDVCVMELMRERLFRRANAPQWKFPIHEYIEVQAGWNCLSFQDVFIEHRPAPDSGPSRINRNIAILQKAAEADNPHPRMLYYYALGRLELQQSEAAIEAFAQYFQHATHQPTWEVYDAHMALALHYKTLKNFPQAQKHCLQAIQLDDQRAKAFNQLGILHCLQSQWTEAIPYLTAASQLKRPMTNFGNESNEDYTWLPYHYLSLCHEQLQHYPEAVQLALSSLPDHPFKDMVKQNLHRMIEHL